MNRITRLLKRKTGLLHIKLADLAGASTVPGMIATIASGDGTYQGDNAAYFDVGCSALRCIRLALLTAEQENVASILDFGCGHGRVLRTLKAAFPTAALTACDINRGGVDFCAETFGATPVYSATRPEDIPLPRRYDLIWCGSVFSHLSEDRWPGFLGLLFAHLELNGVAVLTTCGRTIGDRLRAGDPFYGLDAAQITEILRGFDERGVWLRSAIFRRAG